MTASAGDRFAKEYMMRLHDEAREDAAGAGPAQPTVNASHGDGSAAPPPSVTFQTSHPALYAELANAAPTIWFNHDAIPVRENSVKAADLLKTYARWERLEPVLSSLFPQQCPDGKASPTVNVTRRTVLDLFFEAHACSVVSIQPRKFLYPPNKSIPPPPPPPPPRFNRRWCHSSLRPG